MLDALDKRYPQAEIANSAYHFQKLVEKKDKKIVGVNAYTETVKGHEIDTLYIDKTAEERQIKRIKEIKKARDEKKVKKALENLLSVAKGSENTMNATIECVKAYCTVQEICDIYREVCGVYRDPGKS